MLGLAALAVATVGAVTVPNQTESNLNASTLAQTATAARDPAAVVPTREALVSRSSGRMSAPQTNAASVERASERRALALRRLDETSDGYARELASNRWELPVVGYELTGRFGDVSSLWSSYHTGLDFAAPTGTRIVSATRGVVTSAGWAGSYGNQTIVTLEDGTELWYCHQSRIDVSVGQVISRGEPIGAIGATGNVTGAHLHLEVRPGGAAPVDPYSALTEHGARP